MLSTLFRKDERDMKALMREFRMASLATASLAVILCGLYPLCVWGLGQLLFPHQADGSMLTESGTVVGSRLIGQGFSGREYFHPRPSAAGAGYDAAASGGSNLGPLSKTLLDTAAQRVAAYRQENSLARDALVPADAVTVSGSGLDPHISLQNALLQAPRIAQARNIRLESVTKKIQEHTQGRDLLVLGEPRVNVLMLNMSLSRTR
jgi:potassium-transporting ATPase KdpC subunit